MAVYKFNVTLEDYDDLLRVIEIKSNQTFEDLHKCILQAFGFDDKQLASFYMSDDYWRKGEELSLIEMDEPGPGKKAPPLMGKTKIASFIIDPHQKILYIYDYLNQWTFHLELFQIQVKENPDAVYPLVSRSVGIPPKQYNNIGVPNIHGDESDEFDFIKNEILATDEDETAEGFGEEGEEGETDSEAEEGEAGDEFSQFPSEEEI